MNHQAMTAIKVEAANAALSEMFKKGWLSICVIDSVAAMLGFSPKCEAYRILQTLHCIHFADMTPRLRESIPGLIRECLMQDSFSEFVLIEPESVKAQNGGMLSRLLTFTTRAN